MKIHPVIEDAIKKCNLVFFVGAGFSRQLGLPGWSGLVKNITNELIKEYPEDLSIAQIATQVEKKKLTELNALDALDAKYHHIVLDILSKTLNIAFTDKKLNAHQKLWQITDQIVTTNYDKALESVAPTKIETIVNEDDRGIARLSEIDSFLFKAHGSVTHPSSCILFSDQYRKIYNGKTGVTLELFRILAGKTIIFLGFSLNDPFVNELLQLRQTAYKGLKQNNFIITKGIADFSNLGIERIVAVGNYGQDLQDFLDELIKIRKQYPYGFSMLMRGIQRGQEGLEFDESKLRKHYDDMVERFEREPSREEIAAAMKAGAFDKATMKLKDMLKYNQETRDKNDEETAKTAFDLAELQMLQLKYYQALDPYKLATELRPGIPMYQNGLGSAFFVMGEFEKAKEHYGAALITEMESIEKDPFSVANTINNIGLCLIGEGKYREAIQYFEHALPLVEEDFDNNLALIAAINGSLAGAYYEIGELDKVAHYLDKAIPVQMISLSADSHVKVGTYVHTAGMMHFQKSEYDEALQCFTNALGFIIPKSGEDHPLVAVVYSSMGNVYRSTGNLEKAMEFFQKSLKINEAVFSHTHPSIVACYFNIGTCLGMMGDINKALGDFQEALKICLAIYPDAHPDTALAYHNIGVALSELDANEEGMEYLERSLMMNRKIYGENHPKIADNYTQMAHILKGSRKFKQALDYFEKAYNIIKNILGSEHQDTAQAEKEIILCKNMLSTK